ncbi:MAG: tetratricopeptide repeat protein, partial [Methylotenera sp.]|nr:tetratricopeptide repeat protein [Methylotenera sp.]
MYNAALELARAGHTDQAIEQLQQLVKSHPEIQRYLFDYLQILSWADRDEEVIQQSAKIELQTAPVYVLEAIARAARNLGDFKKSEILYRKAIEKEPKRLSPKLGLGLLLIDQGQADSAIAYLNNREPETARDLYLSVIAEQPDYFNARASLVYAYLEAEQIDKALALAEQLAEEQPTKLEFKQPNGSVVTRDNPKKISADLTAAILRAYADDLDGAQQKLEQLHSQFPDNTDIHSKLAEVYYFRGWPRKARQQINSAQIKAPEHLGLQLTQAKVQRELKDYR